MRVGVDENATDVVPNTGARSFLRLPLIEKLELPGLNAPFANMVDVEPNTKKMTPLFPMVPFASGSVNDTDDVPDAAPDALGVPVPETVIDDVPDADPVPDAVAFLE